MHTLRCIQTCALSKLIVDEFRHLWPIASSTVVTLQYLSIWMSAPRLSWIALGTIFSTLAGNPSWRTLGTVKSLVACDTLPVSMLLLVSCAESGTWCSMLEGTCQSYQPPMCKAITSGTDLFLRLLWQLWVRCVRNALALVVLHVCIEDRCTWVANCVSCVWISKLDSVIWKVCAKLSDLCKCEVVRVVYKVSVKTPDSRDVKIGPTRSSWCHPALLRYLNSRCT
jgi:hypothetical protein